MTQTIILGILSLALGLQKVPASEKEISKNGMEISWEYKGDRIHFELTTPSSGWLCIGFNEGTAMTGAYLLMGRIVDGEAEVVEYHTKSPGNYYPLSDHGIKSSLSDVTGDETDNGTHIRFSLPIAAASEYARDLQNGTAYTITLAYSRSDDFDHHSMMRTSVLKKL